MAPVLSTPEKKALAAAAILLTTNPRKKRRLWAKDIYLNRKTLTHERLLELLDQEEVRSFLRMSMDDFQFLADLIRPAIQRQDTVMREAVSVEQRLLVTLRYLATGASLQDLKFYSAISPQLLSSIIPETCEAIYQGLKHLIQVPTSRTEWELQIKQFGDRWQFPNACGAMDGKHVAVNQPPDSGSTYFNYKKFYSVVLFAVANANYEFLYVNVGANGSASDSSVLTESNFYKKLSTGALNLPTQVKLPNSNETLPPVFLGDSAFALQKNLMKPFPFKNITKEKRIFNYRLSRARRVVENAFGILAARFRVLRQAIQIDIANVESVILACCALHNFLAKRNRTYIGDLADREDNENGTFTPGGWRDCYLTPMNQSEPINVRQRFEHGEKIRQNLTNYFNGRGSVSFQENAVMLSAMNTT